MRFKHRVALVLAAISAVAASVIIATQPAAAQTSAPDAPTITLLTPAAGDPAFSQRLQLTESPDMLTYYGITSYSFDYYIGYNDADGNWVDYFSGSTDSAGMVVIDFTAANPAVDYLIQDRMFVPDGTSSFQSVPQVIWGPDHVPTTSTPPTAPTTLLSSPSTSTPPPPPVPLKWVALGDSFSSGEGVPPFESGSDTSADKCHRSPQAYAYDVARANPGKYKLELHACSGSVVSDFYGKNHKFPSEQAQLKWLTPDTDIVTFTIGGNDAHFKDVLAYCALRRIFQPSCKQAWSGVVDSSIQNLFQGSGKAKDNVPDLLKAIHLQSPTAKIYVVGYPRMFSTTYKPCGTGVPTLYFLPSDMAWINDEVAKIDDRYRAAAQAAGAVYVDNYYAFQGHELCTKETWYNGLLLPKESSYHPNARGQAALATSLVSDMA